MPAARSRASAAAGLPAQRASAGAQALAAGGEGGVDDGEGGEPVARRRRAADERDEPGVDVRLGPEDLAAHRPGPADLAVPGGLHRRDAVGGAAGRSRQPLGHLGLHQDERAVQRGEQLQQVAAAPGRRCCTAGWRPARSAAGPGAPGSAARRPGRPSSRSARSGSRAATVAGSRAASRGSISTATTRATAGSSPRVSDPRPGPDLEDDVVGPQVGGAHDPADRVGVVQEVLAERLGRPQVELLGQLADRGRAQQPVGLLGWVLRRTDHEVRCRSAATGRRRPSL